MSKAIQRRRGTTAEHAGFTGLVGELTIDTTKKTAVVHDGVTAGGHPLAKENHNHDTAYAAKAHESSTSAHPEMEASDAEVDAGSGSKWVKVSQLIRATVKTISSILPITLGGTGASTAAGARTNLGLGSVATENTVPVAKGGTGAATAADARTNLGLGDAAVKTVASTSSGASDSGKLPALDATGKLPSGFIPAVEVSYVPEAGHATTADSATTAASATTATSATTASSATNADKVDGYHASQTPNPNTVPVADASGKLAADWLPAMEAATVAGYAPSVTPGASKIPVADAAGKLDSNWLPALNADTVDGYHAQKTAALDKIPVAGADGKLDDGWLHVGITPGAWLIPKADATGKINEGYIPDTVKPFRLTTGSNIFFYKDAELSQKNSGATSWPSSLGYGKRQIDLELWEGDYSNSNRLAWRSDFYGTVTVSFDMAREGSSGITSGRIQKNGVTVQEWTKTDTTYATFTVDVSVVPGDVITIQVMNSTYSTVYGWKNRNNRILTQAF